MLLQVPILGQRDARWASQRLGTVDGTTIGGYGCIITCMAMLATYYKHPITPDIEDNWLTDNQGYVQGNLYRNDAFPREFKDCTFDKVVSCTTVPAPLGEIDTYLNAGKPVVVMVDFDTDPNDGIQTHFVLLVGKSDNGHYICNDPWTGTQIDFDNKYGSAAKAINQINFFSGPVPQSTPIPTPPVDTIPNYFKTLLQQSNLDINNESQIRGFWQQAIDFPGTNTAKIKAETDLATANNQIATLTGQVATLTEQLKQCQNIPVPTPPTDSQLGLLVSQIRTIVYSSWTWYPFGVNSWKNRLTQLKALLP